MALAACSREHELPSDIPATDCAVAPTALDFGSIQVGTSSDRTFTLTNQGVSTLNGSVGESCSDFSVVGDPAYVLEPGGSRTFTLRFAPGGAGPTSCSLTIGECGALPVSGAGQLSPAACEVTPTVLDFGTVQVGSSAQRTFTIRNEGGSSLSGTVAESCPDFSIVGDASYDLAQDEEATITVRFAPTSPGGKNCVLDTGGACSDVSASGVAEAAPACEVSTSSLSFGTVNVGQSAERSFTIRNTGGGTLSGSVSESCSEFSMIGGTSYSLSANETATFTVRFSPSSAGGKNCTIDTGGGCADVSASGTGQTPTACQVSTTSLSFGTVTVGQSADRTFTITNTGGGTLSGSVSESCPDFSIVGSASYSLSEDESATFTVRFTPGSSGVKNCTIDTGTGCADVSASGTGQLAAACQVSTTSLSFGTVNVGQTADRTFTITNNGGGTLSGTVSESCPEFSIVGSASYNLGAGQSATITVRFAPLTPGGKNCTIDAGASGCADVSATGTGEVLPSVCQLSVSSIDFLDVDVGEITDRQLVVTNVGGGTLSGTLSESCPEFSVVGEASYSLGPLESAIFVLRFAPSSATTFNCTLDVGGSCPDVALTGRGVTPVPPQCQLSTTSHDFGTVEVGRHEDFEIVIANVGGGQLCGTPTESCEHFQWLSTTPYCVVPGTPYRVKVRFRPTAEGSFECTLNPGAGCGAITVRGSGAD